MENNSRNLRPELLQNIFIYLDLKSIFHLFIVCKKWYTLLGSSYFTSFWEEAYKNEFPHLYKRLTTTTQEELFDLKLQEKKNIEKNAKEKNKQSNEITIEEINKENEIKTKEKISENSEEKIEEKYKNENNWLEISLETLKYRFSDYAKKLRENEPKIPTISQIEIFACRLMHSWYKHLPQYPGTKFLIYQRILKVDFSLIYNYKPSEIPTLTVEHSNNNNIVNIWTYYYSSTLPDNFSDINPPLTKIDKLFSCHINCLFGYMKNLYSSFGFILSFNITKELEKRYGKKYDKKNVTYFRFMENLRMTEELIDAAINFVEVIYGVRLEKPKQFLEFTWETKENFKNYIIENKQKVCKIFQN